MALGACRATPQPMVGGGPEARAYLAPRREGPIRVDGRLDENAWRAAPWSERFVDIEYRQLTDHAYVESLLLRLFGERISVEETLRRQRSRPKLDYLRNPDAGRPFAADTLSGGFAEA